jgi:hypothetical protein
MDMKTSLKIFFAAIIFFTLAASPLRAQTNPPIETGMTNTAVTNASVRAAVDNSQDAQSPSGQINIPGIHIGGPGSEDGAGFISGLALMIPIIAIVMGCSIPIVIVGLSLYFRHRKNKMLHETVRAMVDKGVPIPPEMFQKTERDFMKRDKSDDKRPRNDLRTGIMLAGIGIGIVLFIGKPGWIILFLGVAFLVIASLEKKDKNNDQPPKQ